MQTQNSNSNSQMLFETQSIFLSVMYTSPNNVGDPTWFPNSGASNNVTFNPLNLVIITEFLGREQL